MTYRTAPVNAFITALSTLLLLTSTAGSEDVFYIPDIYTCTGREYIEDLGQDAETTYGMKMAITAYREAMEVELANLVNEIEADLSDAPEYLCAFNDDHSAYLSYANTKASLHEEAYWWRRYDDNGTWFRDDGTFRGLMYSSVYDDMIWERILTYLFYLRGVWTDEAAETCGEPLTHWREFNCDGVIGGPPPFPLRED